MLALAAVIMAAPAEAKKKKNSAAPVKSEVRTPAKKGLFNVQFHKDKYYFQIPDSLLGRLLMVNTRFVSTPVDAGVYGGELANSQVLYWEKRGKQLYLRANLYDTRTDSADAVLHHRRVLPCMDYRSGRKGSHPAGGHLHRQRQL